MAQSYYSTVVVQYSMHRNNYRECTFFNYPLTSLVEFLCTLLGRNTSPRVPIQHSIARKKHITQSTNTTQYSEEETHHPEYQYNTV